MLKYEVKTSDIGDDTVRLDLLSILKTDYYADEDKILVNNAYANSITLYEGASVSILTTIYKDGAYQDRTPMAFNDDVTVAECDNEEKTFLFIADKYIDLSLDSITTEVENKNLYLHFLFDSWHYFNSLDNYGITLYVQFSSTERSNDGIIFEGCEFVNDTEIKWRYNGDTNNIDKFMCSIFRNDNYEFIGYGGYNEDVDEKYVEVVSIPERACFTDELYLKKKEEYSNNCWRYELYEKMCNEGTLFGVSVARENFRFRKLSETEEYVTIPLASIPLPISSQTSCDTYQEQNINENFVEDEVRNAKSKTIEMEKYVYHPVFKIGSEYKPIHRIKFNLHFREREEEGWIVKQDGYWNGMDKNGLHSNAGDDNGLQFFSYHITGGDNDPQGRQSDLLCYLDFSNNDVKYQKSRLKKSFLRLSFYDSPNRANQNLLCYSILYMDSGKLFAKMMRGSSRKGLYVVSDQVTSLRYDDLKVNREPCINSESHILNQESSNEEIEEYRLSSQIIVTDRLSSSSSEGFYLYLWADKDKGNLPSDIYMRIEFNHAGYGRIIPFTMPYLSNGGESKIYTFQEMYEAWCPTDPSQPVGWGVTKNEKFSYIHFKYAYDSQNKQYVYYLDNDTYGTYAYNDNTPDELELNLYESKINWE